MSDGRTDAQTAKIVGSYGNAVGKHGPDSEETRAIRRRHRDDAGLLHYFDAMDRIKRRLGGTTPPDLESLLKLAAASLPASTDIVIRVSRGEVTVVADIDGDMAEWGSTWECETVRDQFEDILGHLGIGPKAGVCEDERDEDEAGGEA